MKISKECGSKLIQHEIPNPAYEGKLFGCGIPMNLGKLPINSLYYNIRIWHHSYNENDKIREMEDVIRCSFSSLMFNCASDNTFVISIKVGEFSTSEDSETIRKSINNIDKKLRNLIKLEDA